MLSSRAQLWRSVVGNILSGSSAAKLRWQTHNFKVCLIPSSLGLPENLREKEERGLREEQTNIWGKFALIVLAVGIWICVERRKAERA